MQNIVIFCFLAVILSLSPGSCPSPPRVHFAKISQEHETQNFYPVAVTVKYVCRPGYESSTEHLPTSTCLEDLTWSEVPELCQRKSCGPPNVPNGNFEYTTNLLLGATINITCNHGYRLIGKPSVQCVLSNNDVFWDDIPHCAIIPCLPPPAIENGQLNSRNTDFTYGMAAIYSCNTGFDLIGNNTIHCTADDNLNGMWSGPAPECRVVRCENPTVKNGKRLSGFGLEHRYKSTVTFECNPGHLLNGSSVVTCEADSNWKPPVPTCEPDVVCEEPPTIANGMHNGTKATDFVQGSTVAYECNRGFTLAGEPVLRHCLSDSFMGFSPPSPEVTCPRPPNIANGLHSGQSSDKFSRGVTVYYSCKDGFELVGNASIRCSESGVWSRALPRCQVRPCPMPPGVRNGYHNGQGKAFFTLGMFVTYTCDPGYYRVGDAVVFCRASGNWSRPVPRCEGGS
ncbi:CR1 protein, partial [Columbina picui]|nr:CR1 protein [Columbina picui]